MILFDDKKTIPGTTIVDSLAYVDNCNVDDTRVNMTGNVFLSLLSNVPNYTQYAIKQYTVPYDSSLDQSPAAQFYTQLMTLDDFHGGVQYP